MIGREGDDRLYGGFNRDEIDGGDGDDVLDGDRQRDALDGGPGIDVCLSAYSRLDCEA